MSTVGTNGRAGRSDDTTGLADRVDVVLERRGFTTHGLRVRLAAVLMALSLVPIGALGFALYRLTNLGGPDSVCDGAATSDQVHDLLGSGRISEHRKGYAAAESSPGNSCSASVRSGLFETTEKTVRFTVVRNSKDGPGVLAASDARLFSGNRSGSVTPDAAWAVLPEGCEKGLRAEIRTSETGHDEARARLAVTFAAAAAEARKCGDRRPAAPENLSAKGAETAPDWANLCGLPGFAPAKNPEAQLDVSQQATTAFAPIWSCTIGSGPMHNSWSKYFAITTEPQTTALTQKDGKEVSAIGRARWVAGGTLVVICHGKDVFFTLNGDYQTPSMFPDQDDLARKFLTAGGNAIGCEPIL
ncbi:hypothetical protein ACFY4B_04085 [Kitasatospora sp. NPDC001261]|uniref:hypothetical protein n=1 Tax=Kitasatospora sp. NPDC001261 TaxID=3364012 RepID=UPI0036A8C878